MWNKTKSYKKSVTQATKVENEGPSNPKALYWRAVAKKLANYKVARKIS